MKLGAVLLLLILLFSYGLAPFVQRLCASVEAERVRSVLHGSERARLRLLLALHPGTHGARAEPEGAGHLRALP